jgi:pimeloyl-ACP methyl ester carboxylesterase
MTNKFSFKELTLKPTQIGYLGEVYFEHYQHPLKSNPNRNSEVMLFLHGYPSENERKNRDFLQKVFNHSPHVDCFLIHYPGLGNGKGPFHFSKTFQAAINTHEHLVSFLKYKKVHIFGHSWGGFNTLNLIKQVSNIGTVVLASPFLNIPHGFSSHEFVERIYEDTKKHLLHTSKEEILKDLNSLTITDIFNNNIHWLNKNKKLIHLIQATNDLSTPVEWARSFTSKLTQVRYKEIITDHSFEDTREQVADFILEALTIP